MTIIAETQAEIKEITLPHGAIGKWSVDVDGCVEVSWTHADPPEGQWRIEDFGTDTILLKISGAPSPDRWLTDHGLDDLMHTVSGQKEYITTLQEATRQAIAYEQRCVEVTQALLAVVAKTMIERWKREGVIDLT